MQKILLVTALLLMVNSVLGMVIALIRLVGRRHTPYWRAWSTVQMLLAASFAVLLLSQGLHRQASGTAGVGPPPMDRSSVRASFSSISVQGPHRQLVFHYTLENATDHTFRIDPITCSMVSFRFVQKNQGELPGPPRPNPALSLLENDRRAYAQFTGLERLPTANPAMSLDQCPLELQPKQRREVAIAIPYAYPAAAGQNPGEKDLQMYVRAFMPDINGFGIADMARKYEVNFPRPW